MITVVIAVALVLVGLSATVFPLDFVNAALGVMLDAAQEVATTLSGGSFGVSFSGFEVTTEVGWLFLFVGDALLVIGSLLPGI
jgi:hypothetical protein